MQGGKNDFRASQNQLDVAHANKCVEIHVNWITISKVLLVIKLFDVNALFHV